MNRSSICLSLTGATIAENLKEIEKYNTYCDLYELRADYLEPLSMPALSSFPTQVKKPVILTVRRAADRGHFKGSENERCGILRRCLASGYRYVDLEEDFQDQKTEQAAEAGGVTVIRSFHDFSGVPADLGRRIRNIKRNPGEVIKTAVMVQNTLELFKLVELALELKVRDGWGNRIILGMGPMGFPTRVLSTILGSSITYSSAPGRQAAPGHVDPQTLVDLYRFPLIGEDARIFGVIGNPVMHSESPALHNRGFSSCAIDDAVYLPFQVDNLEAFFKLAEVFAIRGVSVTIPHKQGVIPFLSSRDEGVDAAGACNTIVWRDGLRRGYNTDISGFMAPLKESMGGAIPAGFRAAVIGAGGAARAMVYALRKEGVEVLILNRTVERAKELAAVFDCSYGSLGEQERIADFSDFIVQTTSVGMKQECAEYDPIPGYSFRGSEIVYDLIYIPRLTPLLKRAAQSGCRVINGWEMLVAQAGIQFKLFTGQGLPREANSRIADQY
ncbi:MAG: shikimate dehydrogenase [Spirochaeta sp.]|nr:shikimate dehydrogenase [Spirochaeta sp.]